MATKTVKFTANTTWQEAVVGPAALTINPENRYTDLYVGASNTVPTANTFLLKPVAGENYIDVGLAYGESLYLKARQESGSTVSWVQGDNPSETADLAYPVTPDASNNLPNGVARALWIGGAGTVNLVPGGGGNTAVFFNNVAAGTLLQVSTKAVRVANTSATLIVALY